MGEGVGGLCCRPEGLKGLEELVGRRSAPPRAIFPSSDKNGGDA